MDSVGRLMRRSASRLTGQNESGHDLAVVVDEWQLLTRAVKHCASVQRRASESLLKWSLNEQSRAVRDVCFQFNDLLQVWSDAMAAYDLSLRAAVDQLQKIFSCMNAVNEARKQLTQAKEKEQKLRRQSVRGHRWTKGGDIRLLQEQLCRASQAKDAYEQRYLKEKGDQEVVKAMCFRGALSHVADGLNRYGRQCCVVSQAIRELSALVPAVEGHEMLDSSYHGCGPSRRCVDQARAAIIQLDAGQSPYLSPPPQHCGPSAPYRSLSDAPPPYAP